MRKFNFMGLFMSIFAFAVCFLMVDAQAVFAQAAATIAQPTWLNGVLSFITGNGTAVASGVVILVEFVMRVWPTAVPMSLLVGVQYALNGIVQILKWFSDTIITVLITSANATTSSPSLKLK